MRYLKVNISTMDIMLFEFIIACYAHPSILLCFYNTIFALNMGLIQIIYRKMIAVQANLLD
jgi:hypothetical protein